jgi:hypothetical protein
LCLPFGLLGEQIGDGLLALGFRAQGDEIGLLGRARLALFG